MNEGNAPGEDELRGSRCMLPRKVRRVKVIYLIGIRTEEAVRSLADRHSKPSVRNKGCCDSNAISGSYGGAPRFGS